MSNVLGEIILEDKDAEDALDALMNSLTTHPMRTAVAFRNALLGGGHVAINPMLEHAGLTSGDYFSKFISAMQQTVREGRMLDFGYIPNAIIKSESLRSREMFEAGELLHPYESSWMGITSWEGGYNGYFVLPSMRDAAGDINGVTLVIELYGIEPPALGATIMFYDMVSIKVIGPGETRLQPMPMSATFEGAHIDAVRAANSLDPMVTMLRLLADASVPVTRFEPDAKLNKARTRQGKPPLPGHSVVHAHDYVSKIVAHGNDHGHGNGAGHHASPVAHWRRSHMRHLSGDRVVKVRSSKVNWRSGEEFHRLFSKVPHA